MATPWQQAEKFAQTRWPRLRRQATGAPPTRPVDILDKISNGWVESLPLFGKPAWVFIYCPDGNGLYEWADNQSEPNIMRAALGFTKVATLKSNGGMIFPAVWMPNKKLVVPCVALIENQNLYIFDEPYTDSRSLTEQGWIAYS